eukprot:Hpha_TRINITY_DN7221_c0_g1::TRINITY_DN7221_c0_g1_i1::g.102308::m.102308
MDRRISIHYDNQPIDRQRPAVPRRNYVVKPPDPPRRKPPPWLASHTAQPHPPRRPRRTSRSRPTPCMSSLLPRGELLENLKSSTAEILSGRRKTEPVINTHPDPVLGTPAAEVPPFPPLQVVPATPLFSRLGAAATAVASPLQLPTHAVSYGIATPPQVSLGDAAVVAREESIEGAVADSHPGTAPASEWRPWAGFQPAETWRGPREGWYFGTDALGLGYYRDLRHIERESTRRGPLGSPAQAMALLWEILCTIVGGADNAMQMVLAAAPPLPVREGTEGSMSALESPMSLGSLPLVVPEKAETAADPEAYCEALLVELVGTQLNILLRSNPQLRMGLDSMGSALTERVRRMWKECGQQQAQLRTAPYALADGVVVDRSMSRAAVHEAWICLRQLLDLLKQAARAWILQPRMPPRPSPRAVRCQARPLATRLALHNARHQKILGMVKEKMSYGGSVIQDLPPKEPIPSRAELSRWRLRTAPTATVLPRLEAPEVRLGSPLRAVAEDLHVGWPSPRE